MNNNEIVPGFDDEKDGSIEIRLQNIDEVLGCLVLYLTGYVDTYNSKYFQKQVNKVIQAGFIRLVFNLAGYNMVSSVLFSCFAAFLKAIKPLGGDLILIRIEPKVYEIYQLLGFSEFFNIKDSIEEAVQFFQTGTIFPKIFDCPICLCKQTALKPGQFHCSECQTLFDIDPDGEVFIG